jgi:uncharacterized protein YidB (DUF937 family)
VGGEATELAESLESLLAQDISSPVTETLQEALLNPEFSLTSAQQQTAESALAQTAGTSAIRGLGVASDPAQAATIAPILTEAREESISGLQALEDISLETLTEERGLETEGLINLIEAELPEIVAGTSGGGKLSEGAITYSG